MANHELTRQLPAPPAGKTGWPWTEESEPLPDRMQDGNPWPKISIVTPSFNQGQFLEETIRSVLLQNYPNLEYIIMDGGSTDNSVEIIRKYEPRLTYWVSEKDNGQADAIQRGFEKSTGNIIAWINSDDYYLPNALIVAANYFCTHPVAELLIGSSYHIEETGRQIRKLYGTPQDFDSLLCSGMFFSQPACFWRRDAYLAVGSFDKELTFSFDYDLFLRLTKRRRPGALFQPLAVFRWHGKAKSAVIPEIANKEADAIRKRYERIDANQQALIRQKTHRLLRIYALLGSITDLYFDPGWLFRKLPFIGRTD